MCPENASQKPQIIVDEDWKSRVQAEKEALERQSSAHEPPPAGEAARPLDGGSRELPTPTLSYLVSGLATQALLALGAVAESDASRYPVQLPLARHLIDTLEMLEAKTAGNRTPEESRLLSGVLYELRMTYVSMAASPGAPAGS